MQNGKGSKPRPIKDIKTYLNNWEDINWSKISGTKTISKNLTNTQKKNK
jgi:hypothetical protein